MSMNEFEKRQRDTSAPLAGHKSALPADFSEEEKLFAQELEDLFRPAQEDVPPYFVQTLLESHDPRYQPVEYGFEHKTKVRVFRTLHLRNHLFRQTRPTMHYLLQTPLTISRPITALLTSCLLVMMVTMLLTANSFASGLNVLWAGTHSGVVQVPTYPLKPKTSTHSLVSNAAEADQTHHLSLLQTQKMLQFPLYWPLTVPSSYSLNGVYLYQGLGQQWANGPIVDLEYNFASPGISPNGTGQITICEFKPKGNVLQVVQLGSAQQMQLDGYGHAAIFVDGHWVKMNDGQQWLYGGPGELIYEHDGVVFWIAGDQRDGITKDTLLTIANSLSVFDTESMMRMMKHGAFVTEPGDDANWFFAGDVVSINNSDGSFMSTAGDNDPSSITPTGKLRASTG